MARKRRVKRKRIQWGSYHIRYDKVSGHLEFGYGDIRADGRVKWMTHSGDRTGEIVKSVAVKMRDDITKADQRNKKKRLPWTGFDMGRYGKLILIKKGYDFEVYKIRNNWIKD